jgi:MFS family permease
MDILKNPPSVSKIFFQFWTGFGSGMIGSIVFAIVILVSWSVVGDTLSPSDVDLNEFGVKIDQQTTHPLFVHFITVAIFLGVMAANLAFISLSSITNDRYNYRSTMVTHCFFGNLILLLLLIPCYIIFNIYLKSDGVAIAGIVHGLAAAMLSSLILEIVNQHKHSIINIIALIASMIIFTWVAIPIYGSGTTMFAFLILPLLMGIIAANNSLAESLYAWVYQTYGKDMMSLDQRFGDDYVK